MTFTVGVHAEYVDGKGKTMEVTVLSRPWTPEGGKTPRVLVRPCVGQWPRTRWVNIDRLRKADAE